MKLWVVWRTVNIFLIQVGYSLKSRLLANTGLDNVSSAVNLPDNPGDSRL